MTHAAEFNFDALVGPTHNYAGLAQGNLASQQNRNLVSHPKKAALEGLEKMKFLADLGIPQAVLPPHERPHIPTLRRLGFTGSEADILARAARQAPHLLAACSSASAMWAANAATLSPSADAVDGLLHITPANLSSHLHRSLEAPTTSAILRAVFPGPLFTHHDALPSAPDLADEGAANHNRLCRDHGDPGIELFIYGRDAALPNQLPNRFTPRHTRAASESIARLHQLLPERTFFAQQHADAIDAGVFHNDVIAVAHRYLLLYHEKAFLNAPQLIDNLRRAMAQFADAELLPICIPDALLPLAGAVHSYLFNSQLITLPTGAMALIAPRECQEIPSAVAAIEFLRQQAPILQAIHFVDVRQSMRNGGGPACLRLRIVLTPDQQSALHAGVRFNHPLYTQLRGWIERHYRDQLLPEDLADPQLLIESRTALESLTQILHLPRLYEFQRS